MHKKNWLKTEKLIIFQFRLVEHWLNTNRTKPRAMIKNQGIFYWSKNTFDRSKFYKFEFLKNCRRLCKNNSTQVISWMKCMRMSLNVFQKHEFSTQNFKTRFSNSYPKIFKPLNIFCIKIIEYIILDGQTIFTHNFIY